MRLIRVIIWYISIFLAHNDIFKLKNFINGKGILKNHESAEPDLLALHLAFETGVRTVAKSSLTMTRAYLQKKKRSKQLKTEMLHSRNFISLRVIFLKKYFYRYFSYSLTTCFDTAFTSWHIIIAFKCLFIYLKEENIPRKRRNHYNNVHLAGRIDAVTAF